MVITISVTNSFDEPARVRTNLSAEQTLPAGGSVELTFAYTEDMGPIAVVLEPVLP